MKGFTFPFKCMEKTEIMSVRCRRCGNVWQEEVTHYGAIAGYARNYDCCEKCITSDDRKRLDHEAQE